MFKCNNCGGCCEDPATQINLTLGDIKRLSDYTKKSASQLYKEGMIGIYPFGDPFKDDEFETDVGLFIPCGYRVFKKDKKCKICNVYPARPLNCRIFPFWLLAEAPLDEVEKFAKDYPCTNIDDDFKDDRKLYHKFKEHLVGILSEEIRVTDPFYEKLGLKKKIKVKPTKTKEEDREAIAKIVKDMKMEDFSEIFKKIDGEIKKHEFVSYKKIKNWEDFLEE